MGKLIFVIALVVVLAGMLGGSGCAVIVPPSGGPKDTLPPVLVTAVPKDSALHFNQKIITLTFNEFVQLDNNLNDNLIVSPYPNLLPVVASKLRVVTIRLKDSLLPNTTYTINFGKALKDVNEGNISKNFTYIFSTGDKLDDGKLKGSVAIAETGKVDTTLLVLLHNNLNDTSVKKNNPKYFTRLDSKGNFSFHNLAPGTYNVFVIPNGYTKKYIDSTKLFAFLNAPVTVDTTSQTIKLYAYQQAKPAEKKKPAPRPPSTKKGAPKEVPKLKVSADLSGGPQDLLGPFVFKINEMDVKFDSSKVVLTDSNFVPLKNYTVSAADTTGTIFNITYNWKENLPYKVIIPPDAFKDTLGNTIAKADTVVFKTKRESDYGSIRLHFNNLELRRNPILLLVQNDNVVQSVPLRTNEWYQALFKPGDYSLRILYDTNKNGKWDPGNYAEKTQPEIVDQISYRKVTVKPNQDTEVDINL